MAAKKFLIGGHEADVRTHEDRLVIKIEVTGRSHAQHVYKDLVEKGVVTVVKLD
jgi:hypothetical protein